jgi:hypothetical protein
MSFKAVVPAVGVFNNHGESILACDVQSSSSHKHQLANFQDGVKGSGNK